MAQLKWRGCEKHFEGPVATVCSAVQERSELLVWPNKAHNPGLKEGSGGKQVFKTIVNMSRAAGRPPF